jgi:hypothetical protein
MQQLQPLRVQLPGQVGYTGHIAARPVQAGDKTKLNRVRSGQEDDGDDGRRRLCRLACRKAVRVNHTNVAMN